MILGLAPRIITIKKTYSGYFKRTLFICQIPKLNMNLGTVFPKLYIDLGNIIPKSYVFLLLYAKYYVSLQYKIIGI